MSAGALLRLRGISKTYPAVKALDGVDLAIDPGEIHAVLGENGAGKSTLMKIIYGAVQPDAGEIEWQGAPANVASPAEARARGIGMVFQHFALFESVTVVENVALALADRMPLKQLAQRVGEVSARYGLPVKPWQYVHDLSVDQLFETLRALAAEGTAIIYVSHKLDEIRRLCDRATILRGGKYITEVDPKQTSEGSLAELMIGRTFPHTQRRAHHSGAVALELVELSASGEGPFGTPLRGLNLRLHAGEVLGVAGISGNGQAEFLAALSGESPVADARAVALAGEPIGQLDPGERRQRGLAFVPEERLGRGAVPSMSLAQNALLTGYGQGMVRHGLVDATAATGFAAACIKEYDVRCGGPGAP